MVVNYILEFTRYLNDNDFAISNDKIEKFFKIMSYDEIDFSKKDDLVSLMKITFCSNRMQYELLEQYFDEFLEKIDDLDTISSLEKEKEKNLSSYNKTEEETQSKLRELDKEIEKITNEIKEELEDAEVSILSKKEMEFIENNKKAISKLKIKNKKSKTFIKECIIEMNLEKANEYSANFMHNITDELVKISEEFLKKNKYEEFNICQALFNIIKKLANMGSKKEKVVQTAAKAATKALSDKKREMEAKLERSRREHEEIQRKLNNKINELNSKPKVIEKAQSLNNRNEFIGGKNYVQLTKDAPVVLTKSFVTLNKADMVSINSYIKRNILKFKTRMRKNINTLNKANIDMKKTIQNACKTGGLPLNIYFEEPKANKTKLVLVLDVSGSCKEASTMMLTFMYLLKSVFPGGCKTYAFVDTLYDISSIMDKDDIESSIETVLDTIPRKGVYSNYYKPLKSLWEENKNEITKDSIVIFMGDARNNKNDTGINFIKNISRRAKRAYWLNTEEYSKWGKADSLAFTYSKYFKMFETVNVAEIINFLEKIK